MPPVNEFAPESDSTPSPFFTRPPAPVMPAATPTSKALETTSPPAPSCGVGRPDGRKSAAAPVGTSVVPSNRMDESSALRLNTKLERLTSVFFNTSVWVEMALPVPYENWMSPHVNTEFVNASVDFVPALLDR